MSIPNIQQPPGALGKLTIEITTQCNLRCRGCPRTTAIRAGQWTDTHMPLAVFRGILQHIPPAQFATLHGIGEPTLHPDFIEIAGLAAASKKFGRMKVTTNGLARSTDYYEQAVATGLDEFWVSVDSLSQPVADIMREGTDVRRLIRRLDTFMARGLPLHISMVISAANYADVPATLQILYDLGAPDVHMQEFQDYGDTYGLMSSEQRAGFMARLREFSSTHPEMRISPPNFARPAGAYCTAPWFRPAITVEGYLTPCCTTFDPTHFGLASVAGQEYSSLWRSAAVQSWLRRFLHGETAICTGCALNPLTFGSDQKLAPSGKSGREAHVIAAADITKRKPKPSHAAEVVRSPAPAPGSPTPAGSSVTS